jgi:hypothetical protein
VIDWLTLRVVCAAPVHAGEVVSFRADGTREWDTPKRLQVEGSFSVNVSLRRRPTDGSLEISGNPAKWFQGHNVFGSEAWHLAPAFAVSVIERTGYVLTPSELAAIHAGAFFVSRVDLTESWDFGNVRRATSAVQALADSGCFRHRGKGSQFEEGTVYWRQKSRWLASKAYVKGLELKAHPPTCADPHEIYDVAGGLVRFEFCARSMWLKSRGLDVWANWSTLGVTPASLHAELMAGLTLGDSMMRDAAALDGLPPRLQSAYQLWLDGHDLRQMFPRRSFYRYRSQLLAHGVDIGVKRAREATNVVRLVPILEGKPFAIPDRFRGTPAYFEPRALAA